MSAPTRFLSRFRVATACLVFFPAALFLSSRAAENTSVAPTTATARFEIPATDEGLPGKGPIRRADWFRKLWQERRQAFAASAPHDRGSVVFLGDSITQGWGDKLSRSFPEFAVSNRGISGDTTRGVLIRLAEDVLS